MSVAACSVQVMKHGHSSNDDGQVDDLLSLLFEYAPLQDSEPTSSTPDAPVAPVDVPADADDPEQDPTQNTTADRIGSSRGGDALRAMAQRLCEYADHVDSLGSEHGKAVTVVETCERITGTVAAVSARAMVTAYATADQELPDEAAPGGNRRHCVRDADGDGSDSWVTRRQIAASGISAACRVSAGVARGMLQKALRLTRSMPNALQRAESGDWSGFQLGAVYRSACDLSDDDLAAADERLFAQAGYQTTATLTGRLRRWARKHVPAPPEPEVDHEEGMSRRRVEFSQPDLFGMQWMNVYLSEAFIAGVKAALAEYGKQVDRDDPRTADQIRADVLAAMLFGPAALAPAAAAQLGLGPVASDPHSGYPNIDSEQYGQAQAAWETIVLLMGTLGMSMPAPPKATLTVNVPLATLLCLRAGIMPGGSGAHAPPPGSGPAAPSTTDPTNVAESRPAGASLPDDELADYDREDRAYIDGLGFVPYQVLLFLPSGEPDLQRLVTDDLTGLPLDLGPIRRNPSARMRRRVQLRDRTCRFPYCTRPAVSPWREADLDHVQAHRDDGTGGSTADDNLACLCREHHRIKHQTGWHAEMSEDGAAMTWRNPNLGMTIVTRPGDTYAQTSYL